MNDPEAVALFVGALTSGTIGVWVLAFGVSRIVEFFTALA